MITNVSTRAVHLRLTSMDCRTKLRTVRGLLAGLALLCLSGVLATPAQAQCPMCRISAESNLDNGGSAGAGLNKGILYLFATPYLIIGGLGLYWYLNRRRTEEQEESFMSAGGTLATLADRQQSAKPKVPAASILPEG